MRGTGCACTRGRSVGSSSAPMRCASRTTSGVSSSTIAAADRTKPQTTVPSRISASRESGKDMRRISCRKRWPYVHGSAAAGWPSPGCFGRQMPLLASIRLERALRLRRWRRSTSASPLARRASASSASAMPACRWRWRSPRPASASPASTSTRVGCRRCASTAPTSSTFPPSATTASTAACARPPTTAPSRDARRAHDLRADAALEDARARPLLHRLRRRVGRAEHAPGPARRAPVDDASRHDRGDRAADPRARRRQGRRRLLPRLRAGARRSRQQRLHDPHHAEAGLGRDGGVPAPHRAALPRRSWRPSFPSPARRSPRRRSCTRTPSARSTSRSSNELALMCDKLGISAWEVIDAASTKPFGFLPHYPGPGLGGDCIPVVPHFLAWRMREYGYSAQLIQTAHEINAQMPQLRRPEGERRAQRRRPADQGLAPAAARHGVQARRARHARVAEPRGAAPARSRAAATFATATRGSTRSSSTARATSASSGRARRCARPTASCC